MNNNFLLILGILCICIGVLIIIISIVFGQVSYCMVGILLIAFALLPLGTHYKAQRSKEVFEQKCSQVTEAIELGEKDVYINGVPVPDDFDLDGISLRDYHIEIKKDKIYLTK